MYTPLEAKKAEWVEKLVEPSNIKWECKHNSGWSQPTCRSNCQKAGVSLTANPWPSKCQHPFTIHVQSTNHVKVSCCGTVRCASHCHHTVHDECPKLQTNQNIKYAVADGPFPDIKLSIKIRVALCPDAPDSVCHQPALSMPVLLCLGQVTIKDLYMCVAVCSTLSGDSMKKYRLGSCSLLATP